MKEGLRHIIRQRLSKKSPAALKKRSRAVVRKFLALRAFQKAKTVCFYVSLPFEVDTHSLIRRALAAGKKVLVPKAVVRTKALKLYEIKDLERDLAPGAYGVGEPIPSRCRLASLKEPDLVVVPGLGFQKDGARLGRGAGYYDRFLGKLGPRVLKVGLAFSFQIMPSVPSHDHDVIVDVVLTD